MIEQIKKLQKCKQLDDQVKEMMRDVSTPTLTDYSLIGEMYDIYRSMYVIESPRTRKAFVFVMLYFYCPVAFVKIRRLNNGLRKHLAKTMGCQPTSISHDYREVLFLYEHYKDFKTMTVKIHSLILQYINDNKVKNS